MSAALEIVGYHLRRAQLSVFQRFSEHFAVLDLRPAEFSVLALLNEQPGRNQTEMAELLGIKNANFVPLVNRLEGRGLIERRSSSNDRRANQIHLTPEGASFFEEAARIQDALEAECTDALGGRPSRDALIALLKKLT